MQIPSRRLALRGVAAAAALLTGRRANPHAPLGDIPSYSPAVLGQPITADAEHRKRWKSYNNQSSGRSRQARRRMLRAHLLQGMPASIASNYSWSPTYRAIAAARIREREEYEDDTWFARLRASLGIDW